MHGDKLESDGITGRLADSNRVDDDRAGSWPSNDSREQQGQEELQGEQDIRMGNADLSGCSKQCGTQPVQAEQPTAELRGDSGRLADMHGDGCNQGRERITETGDDGTLRNGFWSDSTAILCADGKHRRIPTQSVLLPMVDGISDEMGTHRNDRDAEIENQAKAGQALHGFPLADPASFRLTGNKSIRPALLKGAGNAINAELAAEFIQAHQEARDQSPGSQQAT